MDAPSADELLELYDDAMHRIHALLSEEQRAVLAEDPVVASVLLMHDLYPVPLEDRVTEALDSVRPYLDSHGGDVELVGVEDGVVRLRMQGSCKGCPSSAATLKLAIEDAIHKTAPDVDGIEAEGAVEEPAGVTQLPMASWTPVSDLLGELSVEDVEGERILFARLHESTYAYRARCAACGGSLADATLAGAELKCAACGHCYDVRVAGRDVDDATLHLDPVPLLSDGNGGVKVALGAHA